MDVARGLTWEQGTGKTKPIIDTVSYLFETGKITGLVVIAPNGVHRNWVSDEIPKHMPERVLKDTLCHIWYSTGTKKHEKSFEEVLNHKGLSVLVMAYDAIMTVRGQKAWKTFLKSRGCVYVLDESQRVKNPGAKRSKRILGSHVAAPYRRILSGTPVTNSPFDVYNQLRFLKPDIWHSLGITCFGEFKAFFGVWETRKTHDDRSYPDCVAYKNLELLNKAMQELCSRVTKDEVLDLPPKLYSKRYHDLTPEQQKIYEQLREDYTIEMATGNLTIMLALTRILRMQQCVCGYMPRNDDDRTLQRIPGPNLRIALLGEVCEDLAHPAIIWARFREDFDLIKEHPLFTGKKSIMVNGLIPQQERGPLLDAFNRGEAQWLLASAACIGTGFSFCRAKTSIYYSNSFSYEHRAQSEDRNHRIGQDNPVHYIDLAAHGTVDIKIITALREKHDVASQINGDNLKEWI
jgi:SNF2 family DNA or RNA helicase